MSDVAEPGPVVPEHVVKAATEAFGDLAEKMAALGSSSSSSSSSSNEDAINNQPKSWFIDPFTLMDSLGVGYRAAPTYLTFETLRVASERDPIVAAIIGTRISQIASFARQQPNKYSVGFVVRPRGREKNRRLTKSEKDRVDYLERYLLNTGMDFNAERDDFPAFLKKFVRDSLTYDAASLEKVKSYGGDPHSFYAVDGSSIRIANPLIAKGTPPEEADLKRQIRYIQYINAQRVEEYTSEELAYLVRNPRSNIRVYRYGFPEIEVLMTTITSHLWAEEHNRRSFSQGSTVKGVLNLKGKIPPAQLEMMKKQWTAQISGVSNAWKTPLVNSDGVEFIPLQLNNQEMGYQLWMDYLCKIACAIFLIDPAEINFDLRGGTGQQPMFMSSNEAQQKVSRDRGLQPLLRFIEDSLNRHVLWQIDDRFELGFVGLDAKTEEQAAQLRIQQGQAYMTLNEVRALEDLPALPGGNVVLNPVYTASMQFEKQMAQQAAAGGGGAAGGGEEPPPTEEDRAFLSKPAEEERQAAGRLLQFLGREGDKAEADEEKEDGGEDDKKGGPSAKVYEDLLRDDWVSTQHNALQLGDLRKGPSDPKRRYELIDIDD